MRIEKKIRDYLVFSGDSILDALNHINLNKSRIVFVVEDNGALIGAVSDGDIRRWLTQGGEFNLNLPIDQVMNRKFVSCSIDSPSNKILLNFDHKCTIIPLVDEQGRFVALARESKSEFQIGNFEISDHSPTFIIAEVGNNHNGDFGLAKELVDIAAEASVDCVKFQMRNLSSLYSNLGKNGDASYDLGPQYTLDLLNKFQLSSDELCQVFDYCKKRNVLPLCTPWDFVSVEVLNDYGLEGFKVASADLTNNLLLEALAKTNKPLICSTGMCKEGEIRGAISLLRRLGVSFALLHCNSTYPTPFKDVNLNYLSRLKELSGAVVGYSGHERGFAIPLAAVALGARIVEKHLTIDRNMEGNDHKVSLLPSEFAQMIKQIRNIEESMGHSMERELTQGELINRENLAKSLFINCDLPKGEVIQRGMVIVKSPGQGIQPNRIDELVGKIAKRDLKAGDIFFEADINSKTEKKGSYNFSRPYGIPARYHDYQALIKGMNLDFVEFHLSYHDLDLNLSDFFVNPQSIGFAVHSPELFAGDHILDLASSDESYRLHSIEQLKRTVLVVNQLRQYFPKTPKPVLVLNAGGWSTEGFKPAESRAKLYDRVAKSLESIDLGSIELAIQTMPPFPWHFGGQSYHNLFVDPKEISSFCKLTGHRVCLDVSHSMMACNFYNWDFKNFLNLVLPFTIHMHVVDAKGVDGEGVQIGSGDVNFTMLRDQINKLSPNVQFIPEVWQGHKNMGEGFWDALDFLEKLSF
jgi:sialic acid synthase SpsE/sugar phosphate isomerase/epimerase